jgi:phosphoglycerate kinase
MTKLFIEDLDVRSKRVIVRTDYNVPVKDGKVEDDKRIVASLPTVNYLLEKGAAVILMSHLGRPNGKAKPEFSLKPVADRLQELLERPVKFLNDCLGPEVEKACAAMKPGDVILLENLRFHIEEEGKAKLEDGSKVKAKEEDVKAFRAKLTKLADIYVNDAFGTAHRDHSSMTGINLPQRACGYLMKKELDFLGAAVEDPKRPFVAILGGAKVSDKISVIDNLLPKVDTLIVGGGMAFTFAKAKGLEIGDSLCENDKLDLAKQIMAEAGGKLRLQTDVLVTDKLDLKARTIGAAKTVDAEAIPPEWIGIDIGPRTIDDFSEVVRAAKTVVWNGPMGVFEIEASSRGTFAIARAMADATVKGATTVVGGGDSASAVKKAGLSNEVSHVSTGGGASLEFLEGKPLPGVTALSDK